MGLPVIDYELYTPIILTTLGDLQVGWIVDEVTGVVDSPVEDISTPDKVLPEGLGHSQAMSGIFYALEQPVLILDPGCILHSLQFNKIKQALDENQLINETGSPNAATTSVPGLYGPTDADYSAVRGPAQAMAGMQVAENDAISSSGLLPADYVAAKPRKSSKRAKHDEEEH
jgi:hypothetical protein